MSAGCLHHVLHERRRAVRVRRKLRLGHRRRHADGQQTARVKAVVDAETDAMDVAFCLHHPQSIRPRVSDRRHERGRPGGGAHGPRRHAVSRGRQPSFGRHSGMDPISARSFRGHRRGAAARYANPNRRSDGPSLPRQRPHRPGGDIRVPERNNCRASRRHTSLCGPHQRHLRPIEHPIEGACSTGPLPVSAARALCRPELDRWNAWRTPPR